MSAWKKHTITRIAATATVEITPLPDRTTEND
jgi:hypothetical protein